MSFTGYCIATAIILAFVVAEWIAFVQLRRADKERGK